MAWRLIEIDAPTEPGDLTNWDLIGLGLKLYEHAEPFDPISDPFHRLRQKLDVAIRKASSGDPDK